MRNQARKTEKTARALMTDSLASVRFLPWMLILFVGSGCAALIYEVVWLQLLQLTIGSTGISLWVLLGTFMGGMCLGSLLLPRLISAENHPLRVYASLELRIGALGVAILIGVPLLKDLYIEFTGHGVMARAAIAVICLMPPTILMGATLPAVARCVKATPEGVSWMGWFYAGNTGGAVLGCLLAGFFLLRLYDMPTATYTAVTINAAAAVALALASKIPWRKAMAEQPEPPAEGARGKSGVYVVIGLSGLCALGAEVVWTRLLSLPLAATVYTFSIILAVFLTGIGIGSSAGAYLARRVARGRAALGACQLIIAAAVAWSAMVIYRLPQWLIEPNEITKNYGPWVMSLFDILRTTMALLPGALLWGASFPLALAAVADRERDPGRMVGRVYAANTVGAILGSLVFSMMVIPLVGIQWGHRLLIMLAETSALVAFWPIMTSREGVTETGSGTLSKGKLAGTVLSLAAVVRLVMFVSPVNWVAVAFGRFAPGWMKMAATEGIVAERDVPVERSPDVGKRYCLYVGEGMNMSVVVTKSITGWRYFHGAGNVQASSNPQDMRLQRMLGHLSVLTRPNPREVKDLLVVACGAGVTAGSFIPYPDIENITICDIEPLVP